MTKPEKVTKEKAEEESSEIPKDEGVSQDLQKTLLDKLEAFEERMNALQEENKLLSEQMRLKDQLGQNPLAYAGGKQDKKIEAPNVIPSYSAKLLKAMEEDDKMVEGRFEYKEITSAKEAKGATVKFHYKKYPGKPVVTYTLVHNQITRLPLGVAKHINGALGGCKYTIHKHVMDEETGKQRIDSGDVVHRMGFHSTEYL